MNLQGMRRDREKLLSLRGEVSTLRFEIERAVSKSKHEGAIRDHDYRDTWDIIHPKSGKPFKAHSHWFNRFGTDDQKKVMDRRRREIERAIHADKRQKREEIDKEIKEIYEKYRYLWEGLDSYPFEGRACDGESDLADLLWVAIIVLERCLADHG